MKFDPALIIATLIGLFVLYIICRIFIRQILWIVKLALSCAIGCAAMLLINRFGAPFGMTLALNPLTAMISGVLGLPGIAMALVLQAIL